MAGSVTTRPPAHDEPLVHTLAHLVQEGVIDEALAHRIEAERDQDAAELALAAAAAVPTPSRARLPEVFGYLGAAFVVAAGLLVVARFWRDMGLALQVTVAATGAIALVAAALVIAYTTRGGWVALRTTADAPRRRLVGVLLVPAAPLAALSLGLVLDDAGVQAGLLPAAIVALAVCAVAVGVAPGVVPTLGLFAAGGFTIAGFGDLFDSVSTLAWLMAVVAAGVVWTVLAPRLTGVRTLALCLGLFTAVYAGFMAAQYEVQEGTSMDEFGNTFVYGPLEWGAHAVAPFGYLVLVGVAAAGVWMYLRTAFWPWIAAAGLAAAALVGTLAAEQFGAIAAFFVAGVILLAVSAVLLIRRGKHAQV